MSQNTAHEITTEKTTRKWIRPHPDSQEYPRTNQGTQSNYNTVVE